MERRPMGGFGTMAMAKALAFLAELSPFVPVSANPLRALTRSMVGGHRHGTRYRRGTRGTLGAFGGQRTTRLVCGKADPSRHTEADQRAAKRGGKSSHRFGLYVGDM